VSGEISTLTAAGRFEEALAALASRAGVKLAGRVDFDAVFDPEKVFPVDGRDRPSCDAAGLRTGLAATAAAARVPELRAGAALLRGALEVCAGRYDAALKTLERAAKLSPRDAWPLLWRFRAVARCDFMARQTYRFQKGVRELDRAVALDPSNPHAWVWRSRCLKTMSFVDRALKDMDRAVALAPDYLFPRAVRGNINAELGRKAQALEDCAEIMRRAPGKAWAVAQTARVKARCGLLKECLDELDQAVALEPGNGTIVAWRGEARRKAGRLEESEADFRRAAALKPRYAIALIWLARVLIPRGEYAEACALLDEAIGQISHNELAPGYRWQARLKLGRFQEALDDYLPFSHMQIEELWTPREAKPDEIKAAFAALAAAHPRDPWALAWRGRALASLREPDREKALLFLDQSLRLKPRQPWAALWRAELIYHRQGAAAAPCR
jgi:tetratricopeptide (TPR) repeat protein